MQWLKDLWSNWKIQITVVGGAVVIATAYGQCSVTPDLGGLFGGDDVEESSEDAEVEIEEVSSTGDAAEGAITTAENTDAVGTTESTEATTTTN